MSHKSSLGQADHEKRSKLSHVKGTGSSQAGNKHWVAGKVASILGLPLILYTVVSMIVIDITHRQSVIAWVKNPINSVMIILGIAFFAWHLMLAAEEAVHDYIDSIFVEVASLLLLRLFTIASIVFVAFSVMMIALK